MPSSIRDLSDSPRAGKTTFWESDLPVFSLSASTVGHLQNLLSNTKMLHSFRPNYSTKILLTLPEPNLAKRIRYICEFQCLKFNPNYEISRQAAFPVQESVFFSWPVCYIKKKKARPITLPRFSVSVCWELLGPLPDPGLKLLCRPSG